MQVIKLFSKIKKSILIFLLFQSKLFGINIDFDQIITEHPLYLSAVAQINSIEAGIDKEQLLYLPLKGSASINTFGSIVDPSINFSLGVNLNYPLLKYEEKNSYVSKYKILESSKQYKRNIYQSLKYNIYKLILDYIINKRMHNLAVENFTSIENYTKLIEKRFTGSDISKSEKAYAESILLKNKAVIIDSEFYVKKSLSQYSKETGEILDPEIDIEMLGLTYKKDLNYLNIIQNNPEILQMKLQIDNTIFLSENITNNSYPQVNLKAGLKFPFDTSSSWQLGADITFPIYGIVYDSITKKEYEYDITSKVEQMNSLIKNKKSNIELLNEKISNIELKKDIYQESLNQSQIYLDGVLIESKAGVSTVFDVIDAKNSLAAIKKYIVESENDLFRAKLEYMYLTGEFNNAPN